ncbi:hypothetical protein LZZ85_25985 [Terrimonas sp. NA20]|uniref:Uncharacterized protein n=1 Tax=Terrimonas ginsenosidimutans TaxID=2908004 RepID=A0ABS9KZN2_9BACT|nr:hypothetical protein [Terrimonas ginsenosidimutans]MCG2617778.1 hypothetical protein [Terrimonas ginsenosidimutans]
MIIALAFTIHSGFHYSAKHRRPWIYLRVIASANILYCCLTAGLMLFFAAQLSRVELIYLTGEILLIGLLSAIELRLSQHNQ